jgi:hypothetical protein
MYDLKNVQKKIICSQKLNHLFSSFYNSNFVICKVVDLNSTPNKSFGLVWQIKVCAAIFYGPSHVKSLNTPTTGPTSYKHNLLDTTHSNTKQQQTE